MESDGLSTNVDSRQVALSVRHHGIELLQQIAAGENPCRAQLCQLLLQQRIDFAPASACKAGDDELSRLVRRFVADNVERLFPRRFSTDTASSSSPPASDVPSLSTFLHDLSSADESAKFFRDVRDGMTVCCRVRVAGEDSIDLRLICTDNAMERDVELLDIQMDVRRADWPLLSQLKLERGDYVRARISAVDADERRFQLDFPDDHDSQLGLIEYADLPAYYRAGRDCHSDDSYSDCLRKASSFKNPASASALCESLGLVDARSSGAQSFLPALRRANTRAAEFASSLRKVQSQRLAMKSVVRGVERARDGHNVEAMQHLNKALQVDADNVEALVARGALYANAESYELAEKDLETALEQAPTHANARLYLAETLMAHARLLAASERRRQRKRAADCWARLLRLQPEHAEARLCLRRLEKRRPSKPTDQSPSSSSARKRRRSSAAASDSSGDHSVKVVETPTTAGCLPTQPAELNELANERGVDVAENAQLMARLDSCYKQFQSHMQRSRAELMPSSNGERAASAASGEARPPSADSDVVVVVAPAVQRQTSAPNNHSHPPTDAATPDAANRLSTDQPPPASAPDRKLKRNLKQMEDFIAGLKRKSC